MVMKLVVLLITRPQLRSTMPGTAARIIWTAPHEIYAVEAVHEIRGNFGVCRKVGLRIAAKAADADAGIVEEDVDLLAADARRGEPKNLDLTDIEEVFRDLVGT
jgi:hypothetical protein